MIDTAITEPGSPPAGPDPAEDASGAALVVAPWVVIENLEDDYVVAFDPRGDTRLKLARPIYELFRRFVLPAWVESVLPPEPLRRDRALEALRHLETRGLLARPAVVFAGETHTWSPDG